MPSTYSVCGTFEDNIHEDHGQCNPRRLKLDCEDPPSYTTVTSSPLVDGSVCTDANLTTEYDASLTPPIRIIGTIFDTECEAVLDENDDPITGPTY
jgi:hypothetical protein